MTHTLYGLLLLAPLLLVLALPVDAQQTVQSRLRQYGPAARTRLKPDFAKQHVPYPPKRLVLVGIKDQSVLQLYAPDARGAMRFIRAYPILAASGDLGPKLREGDFQVPEGIYAIDLLNPNSSYHLSLRINYPNADDRRIARLEKRENLGGDIMIHGNAVSAGCLAMGDTAAEDLFVLAADTGLPRITVLLTPVDFRTTKLPPQQPAWVNTRYTRLAKELQQLPAPPKTATAATRAQVALAHLRNSRSPLALLLILAAALLFLTALLRHIIHKRQPHA